MFPQKENQNQGNQDFENQKHVKIYFDVGNQTDESDDAGQSQQIKYNRWKGNKFIKSCTEKEQQNDIEWNRNQSWNCGA